MEAAVVVLEELGVPCEVDVVSAHRMPEEMVEYGRSAEERGLRVLVARAGGAAHLPGMLASVTSLPVIGVPVPLKHLEQPGLAALHRPDAGRGARRDGVRSAVRATPASWPRASSVLVRARRRLG